MASLLGRQPTCDVSYKPRSRLPLLSTRTAVTLSVSECHPFGRYQFILLDKEQRHTCEQLALGHCLTTKQPWTEPLPPVWGEGGAGSPSSTMWPGPRPTSVPRAILIRPAVWPQQTWAENWELQIASPMPYLLLRHATLLRSNEK